MNSGGDWPRLPRGRGWGEWLLWTATTTLLGGALAIAVLGLCGRWPPW